MLSQQRSSKNLRHWYTLLTVCVAFLHMLSKLIFTARMGEDRRVTIAPIYKYGIEA